MRLICYNLFKIHKNVNVGQLYHVHGEIWVIRDSPSEIGKHLACLKTGKLSESSSIVAEEEWICKYLLILVPLKNISVDLMPLVNFWLIDTCFDVYLLVIVFHLLVWSLVAILVWICLNYCLCFDDIHEFEILLL